MEEQINLKMALRAFDTIVAEGHRNGDEYLLDGLTAYTDFEGCTATIRNDYVRLDIFFHKKICFNYSSEKEKSLFLEKIDTWFTDGEDEPCVSETKQSARL